MTRSGTTGDAPLDTEYEERVPQEQVQDNAAWETGTEKDPPTEDKDAYWDEVSDENKQDQAGSGSGSEG